MLVTRIAIDGLWRCLCPSIDAIAVSQLSLPVRGASVRPCLRTTQLVVSQPSRSCVSRSVHSKIEIKLEERNNATKTTIDNITPSRTPSANLKPSSPYGSLDEVPITELHDTLRNIGTKNGAYKSIADLVEYIITSRGEKPSLLLYDALVRANADASHGSAKAIATLLQEVKDEKIVPDSNLYHSALQVRSWLSTSSVSRILAANCKLQALAIHPDYLLRTEVLREMKNRWYTLTTDGWHYLIVGLLRDRQYEIALDKLEQMQQEGIRVHPWLYDIFIYLFCEAEELDEALKILQYRVDQGDLDISANVWYYMLDACSTNYHVSVISGVI